MTREETNEIIERQGVYEIVYRKDDEERVWYISNIDLHKDYDGKVVTAFCHELEKDLNYSISKIVSARRYWIDIIEEDDVAPQSGIYLFTCRGDNHLITELYHLDQGERFYKYFEGEYGHMNGWFEVIPLAYHLVSDFDTETLHSGWSAMPEELKYKLRSVIRIIAFKCTNPVKMLSYVANDASGVQYFLLDTLDLFGPDTPFNPKGDANSKPLGLYTALSYTEMNYGIHWDLYNKAHHRTKE